jgi:membrane fusion protein, macrolide-specific efflux system
LEFFKNKKIIIGFIALLVLIVLALGYYRNSFSSQEKIKPKRGDVVESIYGLGTVLADQVFHVRVGLALTVQKIFVKEGDHVKQNDPLVRLDETIMRTPIDGTVTSIAYKDGELVSPQVSVVNVTNLKKLFLEVSLEQQSVLRIKKDQKVAVSFESLRDEKYTAKVASVYPRDNQFIVRIELSEWPVGVIPGMTADVAILVDEKSDVLLIPIRCIVAGHVTRIRHNAKERVAVKLGVIDGAWAEIISDNISEDDELIIRK